MLDVIGRSQRGRVCDFKRGEALVRTPAVISSYDGPSEDPMYIQEGDVRKLVVMGSEMPIDTKLFITASSGISIETLCTDGVLVTRLPFTGEEEIPDDVELVVVSNGYELRREPRKAIESIIAIREKIGYNRLLCILGLAEPSTMALYAYMGVDVFDDSLPRAAGINGIKLIPEGDVSTGTDVSEINCKEMLIEREKIITFTMAQRLRELVDQRATASPSSVALLRIFDRVGFAYQEEACSTVGCRFSCNTTQSLRRPDLIRYRERIMDSYVKPEHKRVLLILPCSAKKPYHISKTHKAFASAIHTASHDTLVHEVIVTSPLGIVPRELDVYYPANSYDIPVTGEWKCEEKRMIREMLSKIISQGYDRIVCHIDDRELVEGLADMEFTVVGDPTSPASLRNLDEALRRNTKEMEPVDYYVERREAMRTVLVYQFGKETAGLLMNDNTYAIGKFPYWKLMREDMNDKTKKIQLGMLTPERGMVSLTFEGAEVIAASGSFTVEMMPFEMKGNLFAVGVSKADPRIRIGDEAVIVCNGEVKGVGVAMMSGREMTELKRGIAVKTRHKVK
jgi:archaeosine synthase alpha-subunit